MVHSSSNSLSKKPAKWSYPNDQTRVQAFPMAEKGKSSKSRVLIHSNSNSLSKKPAKQSFPKDQTRVQALPMAEKGRSSKSRVLVHSNSNSLSKKPAKQSYPKDQTPVQALTMAEKGKSSKSRVRTSFVCKLCADRKILRKLFSVKGCSHAYCADCMVKYVASKVQDNITSIGCPVSDCRGSLDPEYCRRILPQRVFDRWGKALCETGIAGAQKFYCPFKDCSALLIDDGGVAIRESECPYCHRLFCAQCRVPWHSEIQCAEFQKLNKNERQREDIMLVKLAQSKKWQRCPNCRYYVEKREGCLYMKCRCRTAFCYNCGNIADDLNNQYHFCSKCKR